MNTVSRSGWDGLKVNFPGLPPFTLLSRFHIPEWEGLVFNLCLVFDLMSSWPLLTSAQDSLASLKALEAFCFKEKNSHIWLIIFLINFFSFAAPHSILDLSSPNRDWTHTLSYESTVLITAQPGNSQGAAIFNCSLRLFYSKINVR